MADYPETIKEDLSHVRWICDSSFSGKTSVTKKLPGNRNVDAYYSESHSQEHAARADPQKQPKLYEYKKILEKAEKIGSMDFFYLRPINEQKEIRVNGYEEHFWMCVDDLLELPSNNNFVLDGGAMWLEQVVEVADVKNIICLVTTDELLKKAETIKQPKRRQEPD